MLFESLKRALTYQNNPSWRLIFEWYLFFVSRLGRIGLWLAIIRAMLACVGTIVSYVPLYTGKLPLEGGNCPILLG